MPSSPAVIGVDSSTQSTKAVVVDASSGRVLATGRAAHTVTGTAGARESDPEQWWRALAEAVARALAGLDARAVTGIAVAGQQHGLVTLDASGRPLRPALLWNDTRSAPQAAALTAKLGAEGWLARTGSVPVASMTAAKWRWLCEHEPRTARAAAAVRLPHDFLTERLSGTAATDPGDASGTCWYSPATGAYDSGLLDLLELDAALLPAVAPTGATRAGSLTAAAARELGLPEGIAVAAGTGDNMAAAVGLGLGGQGLLDHPVVSLGTSGTVFAATRTRPATAALAGFAATDGAGVHLPLGCTLNCTLAVDKVAALLGLDREDAVPGGEAVLLPYLDGERTPDLPHASGLLTGLRHATTRQQLLGAAYEGAVFTVLRALDALPRTGEDVPLRLIGGGARGRTWVETVRRLSGRPVVLPRATELVALGAAALAAGATTGEDPVAVATNWGGGTGETLPPVARDRAAWDRIAAALPAAGALGRP
ncbi:xylulokinase [Streptomyces sp. WAC05374]|uniref:xylulokinase n=1 Tax=Streptomyces sp. WAC05374 TaxID=2487420 RepID=UPI000F888791|nr:xylulokinase [Streptomyces sp. WAC05374]RST14300.1 xylulokinase [Streptomyces sp. WAC05374]TDF40621.1 xylulokinase [Streptomyces sp. WAC05374]TDF49470.1 xylulokinase [Streptomyces sp. WAC05374]TDF49837.1 xylulokinase [Streptomyces sp. WAC05374]